MCALKMSGCLLMKKTVSAVSAVSLLLAATAVRADHPMEELEVIGTGHAGQLAIDAGRAASPDSGKLLDKLPGANANNNGPLTSIAQFRGMYGDRVAVLIDGMPMTGGGPNAMDAPLSYAPGVLLDSVTVHRGITPVSVAQQSIGGSFQVETRQAGFADSENWQLHGDVTAFAGSNADSSGVFTGLYAGNNQHRLRLAGMDERGDDYRFAGGEVEPGEYQRSCFELGYAFDIGGHSGSLDIIRNETGDAGTPALPMDIRYFDSNFTRLAYGFRQGNSNWRIKWQNTDIEHVMTNYHLRQPPADMARWRSTLATANVNDAGLYYEHAGASLLWRVGVDVHEGLHDAVISNPNNPAFMMVNFNDAESRIAGLFVETETALDERHRLDAGVRVNRVAMDSGTVAFAGMMGPMAANATVLRDDFNNNDRDHVDHNVDVVLKWHYRLAEQWRFSTELGRKMRSASYQERYLWIPMESTGGLADGFTYIGNRDLDAEAAHELNLGLEWNDGRSYIAPRIFYREVDNYIQGTPVVANPADPVITAALMLANMMSGQPPLQFNNVDATLYGLDIDWHSRLNQQIGLRGVISMVRGERDDIDDNLYRVSPDHASVALDYHWQRVISTLEVVGYRKQNRVSATNNEQQTAGYGLINVSLFYPLSGDLAIYAGIDNLFDREYAHHLSGSNRVTGSDVAVGERLPGMGRNAWLRINWQF